MNGLGTGGAGGFDDALPAQVAFFGAAGTNMHGLVAGGDVFGVGVGIGIHRHGLHTQAAGGSGDAASNLATVCDQDFF